MEISGAGSNIKATSRPEASVKEAKARVDAIKSSAKSSEDMSHVRQASAKQQVAVVTNNPEPASKPQVSSRDSITNSLAREFSRKLSNKPTAPKPAEQAAVSKAPIKNNVEVAVAHAAKKPAEVNQSRDGVVHKDRVKL